MPAIMPGEDIGLAFDMHGCPNRCRHCWLGQASGGHMTEDGARWVVEQFRAFRRPGESQPPWSGVRMLTWAREPDYSQDYPRLYALEQELSDLPSQRPDYEVLSVWRLARDASYPAWAYSIGVRVCQLSFFGLEKATDWAHRRRGAFQDLLIATERVLAVGIRPRWQWFFTKRILPDLSGLIALAEDLRLRQRCEALGGPFTLFLHCPSPDGEAWHLEYLRPTVRDLEQVPAWLREQSERHLGHPIGNPERELVQALLPQESPVAACVADLTGSTGLWFHVEPSFDLYAQACEITPPFCLGNLRRDGLAHCLDAFENDRTAGFQAMFHVPVSALARRFGRLGEQRVYHPSDLKRRWVRMWVDAQGRKEPTDAG